MMGRPSRLNDIQKAEARRRVAAGEKIEPLAIEFGVSYGTMQRACTTKQRPQDRHALGTAIHLAAHAAALFGLTLDQLRVSPKPGSPEIGSAHVYARAAAVAAMRVGNRPIAWEVIADVLAPGGGEHERLNLNRIWRRAQATGRKAA